MNQFAMIKMSTLTPQTRRTQILKMSCTLIQNIITKNKMIRGPINESQG